jgi:hypothetical protein
MVRPARKDVLARVGDRVVLMIGTREVEGAVVEDRGLIGVGGRRIVRVRAELDDEVQEFEVPEDELRLATKERKDRVRLFRDNKGGSFICAACRWSGGNLETRTADEMRQHIEIHRQNCDDVSSALRWLEDQSRKR